MEQKVFIIFEKTPTSVFLANPMEAGGPENWQRMEELPEILEINREQIGKIEYLHK